VVSSDLILKYPGSLLNVSLSSSWRKKGEVLNFPNRDFNGFKKILRYLNNVENNLSDPIEHIKSVPQAEVVFREADFFGYERLCQLIESKFSTNEKKNSVVKRVYGLVDLETFIVLAKSGEVDVFSFILKYGDKQKVFYKFIRFIAESKSGKNGTRKCLVLAINLSTGISKEIIFDKYVGSLTTYLSKEVRGRILNLSYNYVVSLEDLDNPEIVDDIRMDPNSDLSKTISQMHKDGADLILTCCFIEVLNIKYVTGFKLENE